MKTNVLITGASGTLGTEILHQLLAQKDRFNISVFDLQTPDSEKKQNPYKDEIKIFYGDITNPSDTVAAVLNQHVVFHLAALIPPAADRSRELTQKVNFTGTVNLIHNLEKFNPESFLVFSSSVSVYGDRLKNPDIRVDDALLPSNGDIYAESKIAAEHALRDSKLTWTIFRLSAVMGAGNHKISGLMFDMPLETPLEIITPPDAARAFVHSIDSRAELAGKIFNLGGGEKARIGYREFLEKSFELFGLGKLNFPEYAFAKKNYHCGHFADGNEAESILKFRRDDIDSYFKTVKMSVSPVKRLLARISSPIVKRVLLRQSKPYAAYKSNDIAELQKYFGS